jgi:hypothetical protein
MTTSGGSTSPGSNIFGLHTLEFRENYNSTNMILFHFVILYLFNAAHQVLATSGEMTWYDLGGLGSCGTAIVGGQIAMAAVDLPRNHCGSCIEISLNGKTVRGTVADTCPECATGSLDVTKDVFTALTSLEVGRVRVDWTWCESAPPSPPSPPPAQPSHPSEQPSPQSLEPTQPGQPYSQPEQSTPAQASPLDQPAQQWQDNQHWKKEEATTTTQEWRTDWVLTTEEATKTTQDWKDYDSHNDDGKERKDSQNWQRLELLWDTSASAVSTTTWESTSAVYPTCEQVSDTTTRETQGVTESSMEAPKWTRWETKTPSAKQTEASFSSLDEGSESKSSALLVTVLSLIALL